MGHFEKSNRTGRGVPMYEDFIGLSLFDYWPDPGVSL